MLASGERSNNQEVQNWGLDPLFGANVKVLVRDVYRFEKHTDWDIYFFKHRCLTRVHLVGVLVAVDRKEKSILLRLDDGSGSISAVYWGVEEATPINTEHIGSTITVLGRLNVYMNEFQIVVSHFQIETDPHIELLHWIDVAFLWKNVFSKLPEYVDFSAKLKLPQPSAPVNEMVDFLKGYLTQQSKADFTFQEIIHDPIIQHTFSSFLDCSDPKKQIAKTFRFLINSCYVACIDAELDIFQVFCEEKHLRPIVLDIIEKLLSKKAEYSSSGVPQTIIIDQVRALPQFQGLSKAYLSEYLTNLTFMSILYEDGKNCFKISM
eukprot:Sdes_comp15289_c0_seq1m4138